MRTGINKIVDSGFKVLELITKQSNNDWKCNDDPVY